MTTAVKEGLYIPSESWAMTRMRLDTLWQPDEAPHISIVGQTGSGKSYLTRHGILPLVKYDRVLILDCKGDDPTLRGLGKPVTRLPTWQRSVREAFTKREPYDSWYRLKVDEDYARGHWQIDAALQRIWGEGNWYVVVDELRALVDSPANNGYAHKGFYGKMMMRGRSRGVCVISMTQEPKWVPGLFYTQPSFFFMGRVEDEAIHKRLAEIGSSKALFPHLAKVPKRKWIFTHNQEDERHFSLTGL